MGASTRTAAVVHWRKLRFELSAWQKGRPINRDRCGCGSCRLRSGDTITTLVHSRAGKVSGARAPNSRAMPRDVCAVTHDVFTTRSPRAMPRLLLRREARLPKRASHVPFRTRDLRDRRNWPRSRASNYSSARLLVCQPLCCEIAPASVDDSIWPCVKECLFTFSPFRRLFVGFDSIQRAAQMPLSNLDASSRSLAREEKSLMPNVPMA